jgi:hypothetical protein
MDAEAGARKLGLETVTLNARNAREIDSAFERLLDAKADAIITATDPKVPPTGGSHLYAHPNMARGLPRAASLTMACSFNQAPLRCAGPRQSRCRATWRPSRYAHFVPVGAILAGRIVSKPHVRGAEPDWAASHCKPAMASTNKSLAHMNKSTDGV